MKWVKVGWQSWSSFWFESREAKAFAVFRSALGGLLLVFYGIRSLDLRYLYSENGLLSLSAIRDIIPMDSRFSILQFFTGDTALYVCNGVFLLALAALTLGRAVKISSCLALVLHISFMHRNLASPYGIDSIATYFLFYLSVAQTLELESVARRLTQVQICLIYGYSGWEKLKGVSWWRGEALWSVLANSQLARFDFTFVSHFPILIAAASLVTLIWEIYFPVMVWLPKWRRPVLIFGVLFHVGIALTIHITFFSGIMVIAYLAFLTDRDVTGVREKLENLIFRHTGLKFPRHRADRYIV